MMDRKKEGIFWVIDGKIYAFPFEEGSIISEGLAKSGKTYNHEKLWNICERNIWGKPYNYYPRGRVVINSKGKICIYVNPHVDLAIIEEIKHVFSLSDNCKIVYDYSAHYKCYLDDDAKRCVT